MRAQTAVKTGKKDQKMEAPTAQLWMVSFDRGVCHIVMHTNILWISAAGGAHLKKWSLIQLKAQMPTAERSSVDCSSEVTASVNEPQVTLLLDSLVCSRVLKKHTTDYWPDH